jgi:hypothetical protein
MKSDRLATRAAEFHRECDLRAQGVHRVRRRSAITGKVETVWCGLDAPCTCADADRVSRRAAEFHRECALRAQGIHRVRRQSAITGKVETVWCGVDASCRCFDSACADGGG